MLSIVSDWMSFCSPPLQPIQDQFKFEAAACTIISSYNLQSVDASFRDVSFFLLSASDAITTVDWNLIFDWWLSSHNRNMNSNWKKKHFNSIKIKPITFICYTNNLSLSLFSDIFLGELSTIQYIGQHTNAACRWPHCCGNVLYYVHIVSTWCPYWNGS